ncbi:MAG: acetylxylan esterase, partial [Thermoguttaceae bacterium]|nr:acetylxylan esterase [Thermoguttaceae bacterium]
WMVLFAASAAFAGNITFYGNTDKNPLEYKPGENMVFSVQCFNDGQAVDGQKLSWKRSGDDGKTVTGTAVSNAKEPLKIETSIDVPGFVRIQVFALDENDQVIGGEPNQFNGGAGVLLDEIQGYPEPEDFDSFWNRQKEILAQVPVRATLTPVESNDENVLAYDVKVDCAGLAPVSGYLCMPKDAAEKSLPAHVSYQGYGVYSAGKNISAGRSALFFEINAHGILNGQAGEYYQTLRDTFLAGYGFSPEQNSKPESCYWNGMMLRVMRALQYVKSLPEWDGKNLMVSGGSQGGLQCLSAAGLDSDVTEVVAYVPWFCDVSGNVKQARQRSFFMPEWVDGLGYYDTTNHAKRIKAKVTIYSGLGDYCCPPSGQIVLFHAIKSDKKLIFHQGKTHGFTMDKAPEFVLEAPAQSE